MAFNAIFGGIPASPLSALLQHRYLLGQLIRRDVLLRYRGAYFGLLWVLLIPLLMLGVYAFVFTQIFDARWPQQDAAGVPFVLSIYCGLIVYNIFAETVSRAPAAVRSYPNYVKKIIFPTEILAVVPMGAALVHASFNLLILVAALGWTGHLHSTLLLVPVLLLPLVAIGIGLAWFFSAWGVFIKDMSQIVPVLVQMLMFLSPVFYPSQAVPEALRPVYGLNPLVPVIEAVRAAIAGSGIDWLAWSAALVVSFAILWLGHAFFGRSRDEFADAL